MTVNPTKSEDKTVGSHPAVVFGKRDELRLLVNSRHPILTIETSEEERVEQMLFEVASELTVPLFTWSVTTGLARYHGAPIYNSDPPEAALSNMAMVQGDGIFLLKDFARYCDNDKVCRRLRELAEQFRTARRSIVITAGSITLPPELSGETAPFALGLPTMEEILAGVKQTLSDVNRENHISVLLDVQSLQQLAKNLCGLPFDEAMHTLKMCALTLGKVDPSILDAVLDAKREVLRGEGLLETVRRDASFADSTALQRLRECLTKPQEHLTHDGHA